MLQKKQPDRHVNAADVIGVIRSGFPTALFEVRL